MSKTAGQEINSKRHLSLPLASDNNSLGASVVSYIGRVLAVPLPIGPVVATSLQIAGPITQTEGALKSTASTLDDGFGNATLGGDLHAINISATGTILVQGVPVQRQGDPVNAGTNTIQTSGTVIGGTVQGTTATFSFATVGGLPVQQQGTTVNAGANPIQTTGTISAGTFLGGSGAFSGSLSLNGGGVLVQGNGLDAGANTIQTTGLMSAGTLQATVGQFGNTLTVGGTSVQLQGDPVNAGPNTIQNTGIASFGATTVTSLSLPNTTTSTTTTITNANTTANRNITFPDASGVVALVGDPLNTGSIIAGTGLFTGLLTVAGAGITGTLANFGVLNAVTGTFGTLTTTSSLINQGTGVFLGQLSTPGGITGSLATFGALTTTTGTFSTLTTTSSLINQGTGVFLGQLSTPGGITGSLATFGALTSTTGTFTTLTTTSSLINQGTGVFLGQLSTPGGITGSLATFGALTSTTGTFTTLTTTSSLINQGTGVFLGQLSTPGGITGSTITLSSAQVNGPITMQLPGTSSTNYLNAFEAGLVAGSSVVTSFGQSNAAYLGGTMNFLLSSAGTGSHQAKFGLINGPQLSISGTGAFTTPHVVLDDGAGSGQFTGNLVVGGSGTFQGIVTTSGRGAFAGIGNISGVSAASGSAQIGTILSAAGSVVPNSALTAYVQGLSSTATALPLQLQPAPGALYSSASLLDDGTGVMNLGNGLTVNGQDNNAFWSIRRMTGAGSPSTQVMSMSTGGITGVGSVPLVYNYGASGTNQSAFIVTDSLSKGYTGVFLAQAANSARIYSDGAMAVNGPINLGTTTVGQVIGVTGSLLPVMTKLYGSATVPRNITFPDASGTLVVSGAGGGVQLSAPFSVVTTGGVTSFAVADSASAITGTAVTTKSNTLDDSNGAMILNSAYSGNQNTLTINAPLMSPGHAMATYLGVSANTGAFFGFTYLGSTGPTSLTNNAFISVNGGTNQLVLQASGKLFTNNSTLDDGAGNLFTSGAVAAHGVRPTTFTQASAQLGTYAGGLGNAPAATTAYLQGASGSSNTGLPLQLQPGGGALYSTYNVLDDGTTGNVTLSNNVSMTNSPAVIQFTQPGSLQNPTFSTLSTGAKLVIYPGLSGLSVDYGFGVGSTNNLWSSVANFTSSWDWFAGTTSVMTLTGRGSLTVNNGTTGGASTVPLQAFQSTVPTSGTVGFQLGQANGTNQAGLLQFNYVSSGSASNAVQLGMVGSTPGLKVNGSGKVTTGFGTVLDDGAGNMQVTGTFTTSISGTTSQFTAGNILVPAVATNNFVAFNVGRGTTTSLDSGQLLYGYSGASSVRNTIQLKLNSGTNYLQVSGSSAVSTANTTLDDGSGNMILGAGQANNSITFSSSTSSILQFSPAFGDPSFTTRSAGAKVVLIPGPISSTRADYAIGVGTLNDIWYGTPSTTSGHIWYAGINQLMTLGGNGGLATIVGGGTTARNTLDDGNGSMTLNSSTQAPLSINTTSANNSSIKFLVPNLTANTSGGNAALFLMGQDQQNGRSVIFTYNYISATTGANNNFQIGLFGSQTSLTIFGNNKITTVGNTLDDGSGNLAALGTVQARQGSSTQYVQLGVGTSGPNIQGFVLGSGIPSTLQLNPLGGAVSTQHNTLDDGSGNSSFSGTGTFNNLRVNGNAQVFGTLITGGTSVVGNFNCSATGTFGGGLVSGHNTMDDGSGNMTISGNIKMSGAAPTISTGTAANAGLYLNGLSPNGLVQIQNNGVIALNTFSGQAYTNLNTLDDGNGNMVAAANLSAHSVSVNTYDAGGHPASASLLVGSNTTNIGATGFGYAQFVWQPAGGNNSLSNNLLCNIPGMPFNFLTVIPANNHVNMATQVIDDGFGNMFISGSLRAGTTGTSGSAYISTYAPAGVVTAYLQGYSGGGTSTAIPLQLNPIGGTVSTQHSTLDDGSGNMVVGGRVSASSSGTQPAFTFQTAASVTPANAGLWLDASNRIALYASGGVITTTSGGVVRNTLDDGSGNMVVGTGTANPSIKLGGTTSSLLQFSSTSGEPSFTTRSVGTKVLLFPLLTSSSADYAIGVGAFNNLWFGVPTTSAQFVWYGGTGPAMKLTGSGGLSTWSTAGTQRNTLDDGSGNMAATGSITAGTTLKVASSTITGSVSATSITMPSTSGVLALTSQITSTSKLAAYGYNTSSQSIGTSSTPVLLVATQAYSNGGANLVFSGGSIQIGTNSGSGPIGWLMRVQITWTAIAPTNFTLSGSIANGLSNYGGPSPGWVITPSMAGFNLEYTVVVQQNVGGGTGIFSWSVDNQSTTNSGAISFFSFEVTQMTP